MELKKFVILCYLVVLTNSFQTYNQVAKSHWRRQIKKQSPCVNLTARCYSSAQCCEGLVCAAFDGQTGQRPETPGVCVREKDLKVCSSSDDCGGASLCAQLGSSGDTYCLPNFSEEAGARSGLARLKQSCRSDSDCDKTPTIDGYSVCCQDVPRGKMGVKRMCDRVYPFTDCITE